MGGQASPSTLAIDHPPPLQRLGPVSAATILKSPAGRRSLDRLMIFIVRFRCRASLQGVRLNRAAWWGAEVGGMRDRCAAAAGSMYCIPNLYSTSVSQGRLPSSHGYNAESFDDLIGSSRRYSCRTRVFFVRNSSQPGGSRPATVSSCWRLDVWRCFRRPTMSRQTLLFPCRAS